MKRILITTFALLALCAGAAAQDTWFCGEPGTKLSYVKKEAKSGAESKYDYNIKEIIVKDGRTTITFDVAIPGQAGSNGCQVWTENGVFHNDVSASLGQQGNGITAKGNTPLLPETPEVGMTLQDCTVVIDALMLTSEYSKVRFYENGDITVPAGTFHCWCLEYDIVDTVMGLKARNHVQQWYAKGVGEVKSVTKDMSGRVVSETSLAQIVK